LGYQFNICSGLRFRDNCGLTGKVLVFSACGSDEEAGRLARMLVERRLAACVNIVAPVRSIYRWKGQVEEAAEWILIIKTTEQLFPQLRDELRQAHSYELPEIISVPISDGSPDYLAWLGRP